jgi:proteic killer suppression protein
VIKSFRHKGIEKLATQLDLLDTIEGPEEMRVPAWRLHALQGELAGHWAVWVSGNWRLTFTFKGKDAVLVDYQDYH